VLNIIVRQAVVEDIPRLYELGFGAYTKESLAAFEMDLSEEKIKTVASLVLQAGWSFVLEVDDQIVGCIIGASSPFPFSDALVYGELMFFVQKEFRKFTRAFLTRVEMVLKTRGVAKFILANVETNDGEKIDRFYKILGFKRLEIHYMKSLN
jgi:GNAT superfamily N-acetyltransferase